MNAYIQRLPKIQWIRDLNGVSANTAFPSSGTAGVKPEDLAAGPSPNMLGPRVHVLVDYVISTGTASVTASLVGYADTGNAALAASPRWVWIKTLNGGSSIAAQTSKWSPDASTIRYAEAIDVGGAQYSRYATRLVMAGANETVTTYIGFEVG